MTTPNAEAPPSPQPSPPNTGGEGEVTAINQALSLPFSVSSVSSVSSVLGLNEYA